MPPCFGATLGPLGISSDPANIQHDPAVPPLLAGTPTPRGRKRTVLELALLPLEPHPPRHRRLCSGCRWHSRRCSAR